VCGLSNGAIFSDIERPLTQTSRSLDYLMLNISKTVRYTDIVTMKYYRDLIHPTQGCHFEWLRRTWRNIQWYEASRGLFATAELFVYYPSLVWSPRKGVPVGPRGWMKVGIKKVASVGYLCGCKPRHPAVISFE